MLKFAKMKKADLGSLLRHFLFSLFPHYWESCVTAFLNYAPPQHTHMCPFTPLGSCPGEGLWLKHSPGVLGSFSSQDRCVPWRQLRDTFLLPQTSWP